MIPPRCHGSKLPPVTSLLIMLSARNGLTFSTASVLHVLQGIMTETGIWEVTSNEACGRLNEVNSGGHSEVNLRVNLRAIWDPFLDPI